MKDPNAKKEETTAHMVTEGDMANNPELAAEGIKAGDEIGIPTEESLGAGALVD